MAEQAIKTPDGFNQALSEAVELKGTGFQRAEHMARQRLGRVLNAIPDDCFRGGVESGHFYSRLPMLEERALEEHVSTEELDVDSFAIVHLAISSRWLLLDESLVGRAVKDEVIYRYAIRMMATAELAERLNEARKNVPPREQTFSADTQAAGSSRGTQPAPASGERQVS